MDEVILSTQEARELVLSILEAVDFAEGRAPLRDSWAAEMRDWCIQLLDRIEDAGGESPS